MALVVGCGAGVATMTVSVPSRTMYSSSNGPGLVTVDDTEYSETFSHGDYHPETGKYPYVVPPIELPDIPSAHTPEPCR